MSKYSNRSYAYMKVDKLLESAKEAMAATQSAWEFNYPSMETEAASPIADLIKKLEAIGFGD